MQDALAAWWPNPAAFNGSRWARENGVSRGTVGAWPKRFAAMYGRFGGRAAQEVRNMASGTIEAAFKRFRDGWDDPNVKPADRRADLKMLAEFVGLGTGGGGDVNVNVAVVDRREVVFVCSDD